MTLTQRPGEMNQEARLPAWFSGKSQWPALTNPGDTLVPPDRPLACDNLFEKRNHQPTGEERAQPPVKPRALRLGLQGKPEGNLVLRQTQSVERPRCRRRATQGPGGSKGLKPWKGLQSSNTRHWPVRNRQFAPDAALDELVWCRYPA